MSKANFWQRGEALDFPNNTTKVIEASTIMPIGTRLGVIGTDIKPGEMGSILVAGVYEMPKDESEIEMGTTLYFDKDTEVVTREEKTVIAGYAAQAAAASDKAVYVKIGQ